MRTFALFVLLFAGASANFWDSLQGVASSVANGITSATHTVVDALSSQQAQDLLNHVVIPAAEHAALAAVVGKREHSSNNHHHVQTVMTQGAHALEELYHNYAHELQHFHDQIANLNFLHGDPQQFLHELENSKLIHNAQVQQLVHQVEQALSQHSQNKRRDSSLLAGLNGLFHNAVDGLQETFNGVHDQLAQGGNGILGALTGHLQHLTEGLNHLKETGAGMLASGQESLANLHQTAGDLFHQAHAGLQGQAAQVVDTLLHPNGQK